MDGMGLFLQLIVPIIDRRGTLIVHLFAIVSRNCNRNRNCGENG